MCPAQHRARTRTATPSSPLCSRRSERHVRPHDVIDGNRGHDASSRTRRDLRAAARAGRAALSLASVTVIAQSAMVADALATAAFALGRTDAVALPERHGVDALLVTPSLDQLTVGHVHHVGGDRAESQRLGDVASILSHTERPADDRSANPHHCSGVGGDRFTHLPSCCGCRAGCDGG